MTGADTDTDTDGDEYAELALQLQEDARADYEERKAEQEAFLDAVADEEGTDELETECTLVGDYTVTLTTQMDGELIDRMSAVEQRLQRAEAGDAEAVEVSEAADTVAQILADLVDDTSYDKTLFYEVYRSEGLQALGALLRTAFESLEAERERREGAADGFREV